MKRIFFFIFCLGLSGLCSAQARWGLKGGLNLANTHFAPATDFKARLGFHAGGLVRIVLGERLFLRSELLYSQKGYRAPATLYSNEGTVSFHYLNFPFLAELQVNDKLSFLLGPEFGYMVKATTKSNDYRENVSLSFREFDKGLDLGATYQLNERLGAEARYNYGFKGLVRGVYVDQNGNPGGNYRGGANRVLQLGLYYFLTK
ncbi:porin family protein [Paraflavisolibacter sp. H34]|uniref:porin family protein n=1 Tax=Huijunlia imazamoxiresistens TaxID=3127457 RepID=UPI00301A1DFC